MGVKNLKRTRVHMLPTEDASKIALHKDGRGIDFALGNNTFPSSLTIPQHLYFTTDEEIKVGDWFINTNFQKIYQANSENSKNIIEFGPHPEIRKIIATTDPKLLKPQIKQVNWMGSERVANLPQPSQAFIKAYCEQGGIDEIDVEYERVSAFEQRGLPSRLKINILKVDPVHNTIITHRIVEKMYSISDIEAYCDKYPNDTELGREIRKLRYKQ